jgi:hypothetical protein
MTDSLREEIFKELGNLAEFGQQESKTDIILRLLEKRIDTQRAKLDEPITQENSMFNLCPKCWNSALDAIKEMLK